MKSQARLRLRVPEEPTLTMPRVKGKPFRCVCGANVFIKWAAMPIYRCNACGRDYEGS
jgi:hypothetical protein